MEYRRACRLAARATVPEYEQAAVDAAVRRYKEVDPTAPLNRHDAVAAVLEMVSNVILADHLWFWDGLAALSPWDSNDRRPPAEIRATKIFRKTN
jgi:hypothetical protein